MNKIMDNFFNYYENGFTEFFENQKREILYNREDYIDINNQIEDIMQKYPNVRKFIEEGITTEINTEEQDAVLNVIELQDSLKELEIKASFKLGFKEALIYFNEMGILHLNNRRKTFNFEEWSEKYHNLEIVDLKKHFTQEDFETFKKLGIEIKDKVYTEYEYELLNMDMLAYYKSDDMDEEELKMSKPLDETGVSREEYNKLLDKVDNLNYLYNF